MRLGGFKLGRIGSLALCSTVAEILSNLHKLESNSLSRHRFWSFCIADGPSLSIFPSTVTLDTTDGIIESPIEVYFGDAWLYKGDEGAVVFKADPVLTVLIPVMNVSDTRRDKG